MGSYQDLDRHSEQWDEVSEGLPRMDDQFIQKYLQGREALIAQEKKQRSGVSYLLHAKSDVRRSNY